MSEISFESVSQIANYKIKKNWTVYDGTMNGGIRDGVKGFLSWTYSKTSAPPKFNGSSPRAHLCYPASLYSTSWY